VEPGACQGDSDLSVTYWWAGAVGNSNRQVSLSLISKHLQFCSTRDRLVGAARVYSRVPPANIDLMPMAERQGFSPMLKRNLLK
jgi:hypothetical protein